MFILFRALAMGTRSWVYGDLIHKHVSDDLMIQDIASGLRCEVDPATVGQFIGRTDLSGAQIFSGDIIEVNGSVRKVVYFDSDAAAFSVVNAAEYNGPYRKYFCEQPGRHWWLTNSVKVIGNIHERPDLLGQKVED